MKLVTAIIKPFRLADVRDALARIGIQGMTVTEEDEYRSVDVAKCGLEAYPEFTSGAK